MNESPPNSAVEMQPRCPPLITRIPPPSCERSHGVRAAYVAIAAVVLTLLIGKAIVAPGKVVALALGAALALAIGLLAVVWALRDAHARYMVEREAFLVAFPECADDPLPVTLAARWKRPAHPPSIKAILETTRSAPPPEPPRARIVCVQPVSFPEVGDFRFEPIIITPTRAVGRQLVLVGAAAVAFALWAVQELQLLPKFIHLDTTSTPILIGFGALAGGAWAWQAMVRPTYVRIAPGVVQFMRFGWRNAKPVIHSYPMTAGTVVIVRASRNPDVAGMFALARADRQDELSLAHMVKGWDFLLPVWQALLSTAPTPPLSEDELLG